ncbi:hypothetical protein ACIS_00757 [Anaplasma centrale str. Israel]|uniref:Uncharacterized protein n=1 Tax=Anaplasma centrale (strain Israel) TaxID=574556 RepID=D1AS59_ANACI|nr:hypothetical protein [Anaplasma centrale]ACZ49312.1 hypothetical protein ACIS_00757 [Anaplasma centrale str. Israel]
MTGDFGKSTSQTVANGMVESATKRVSFHSSTAGRPSGVYKRRYDIISGDSSGGNGATRSKVALALHMLIIVVATIQLVAAVWITYDLAVKGRLSIVGVALMAACGVVWGLLMCCVCCNGGSMALSLQQGIRVTEVSSSTHIPKDVPVAPLPATAAITKHVVESPVDRASRVQDTLRELGVQEVHDVQVDGHVVLTASYLGKSEDYLTTPVTPKTGAHHVTFRLGRQREILCTIGREVFKVHSWAGGRTNPIIPGRLQIIVRPMFPQNMDAVSYRMYFKRNGTERVEPMHLLKVRVTAESLLSIMFESGVYADCVGSSEALRHYVDFYSRLLLRCSPGASKDSIELGYEYKSVRGSRESVLRLAGKNLPQVAGNNAGAARFLHDVVTYRCAFERLLNFGSITRLEKAFIDSILNSTAKYSVEAICRDGAGTSREFVSALYALTCTRERFFQNLDDMHLTQAIISKFLTDKDFRTIMVARTLNAVHNAIHRIRKKGAQITLDSIISYGHIEESLSYLCRWMPGLFESVSAVLLISSHGLVHMQDLDASIVKWLAVIPGFEVIGVGGDVAEVSAASAKRKNKTAAGSGVDARFLAAIKIAVREAAFNESVAKAVHAALKSAKSNGITGDLKTLQISLAKLNQEGLRAIVAFAVACEIADLIPNGHKCSPEVLREILGPELSSQSMLRVLESAMHGHCEFFTSLISEVAYVHYPSLDRGLVGVRFSTTRETSFIDVTTETSVQTPNGQALQNL